MAQVFPFRNEPTGLADSTKPFNRCGIYKTLRGKNQSVKKSGMESPSNSLNLSCLRFLPPWMFKGPSWTVWAHSRVPSGWCLKVGYYWTFKWTFSPGIQSNSRDSRGGNAAELRATLTSREGMASRIYFPKFRRAHLSWKDKINGHFIVPG